MNRKEGTKHRKRKSNKLKILFWAILFAFVSVLILYLFSLGGENGIAEILNMRDYWLSVGVANGLILIGYLMMYRVDAQNIALNENDLEDTEWLSVKRLKKLKEFQVYDYKAADGKQDGIVIGAEKKGGNVEVITTSQLHALIVGTTFIGTITGSTKASRASSYPIRRKNFTKSTQRILKSRDIKSPFSICASRTVPSGGIR